MRTVSGTRSQVLPLAMPTATSVLPMPVAKAPRRAGRARMRVGADDQVARLGVALGHALMADAHLDVAQRRAGLGAEGADRRLRVGKLAARRRRRVVDEEHAVGALTRAAPSSRICWMASGPVPSWAIATSTSATTIWPGHNAVRPGVRGKDLLGKCERHT